MSKIDPEIQKQIEAHWLHKPIIFMMKLTYWLMVLIAVSSFAFMAFMILYITYSVIV